MKLNKRNMNPFLLFDYIYFFVAYLFGTIWGYPNEKVLRGMGAVSLLQFLNVLSLLNFLFPDYIFAVPLFVRYQMIAEKWNIMIKKKKQLIKISVAVYLSLTIGFFVASLFL